MDTYQPYCPTFAIDSIGSGAAEADVLSIRAVVHLLNALVNINIDYLRMYPQIPLLYASKVFYKRETLDECRIRGAGNSCGDDDWWADIITTIRLGFGDCEDLVGWRVAELIERYKIAAEPWVTRKETIVRKPGVGDVRNHLYHCRVLWPRGLSKYPPFVFESDGLLLEDPSDNLGMRKL